MALRPIRIHYEDGTTDTTSINGTDEEIRAHYEGQSFNFGDTEEHPRDRLLKCVRVEFLDEPNRCITVDHTVQTLTVTIRSIVPVSLEVVKRLLQEKYEVTDLKITDTTHHER